MYPNLYYVFKDWFGVNWEFLKIFNSFGLMVALAFIAAARILTLELKRREKLQLLHPKEETLEVGKPASMGELAFNFFIGFIFGFKIIGAIFNRPETMNMQEFIFSGEGNWLGGLALGGILAYIKWNEKNRQKLAKPETRKIRIWPHDRVNDFVVLALIFGILGAKLFDSVEHWSDFIADPIGVLLSPSGLTFYGGLICAAIAIYYYAYKKGIKASHLSDSVAPALMLAYAIGRIGCQVAGDGDWGIFNSAYISDEQGKMYVAKPGEFEQQLQRYETYFTKGQITDSAGSTHYVTDRAYGTLENTPRKYWKMPGFLPKWLAAYTYPQNVNADGRLIPGNTEEHNRVLPQPVFPTPLYETIICGAFFLLMWGLRKKIKAPWVMFGFYLFLNGVERFAVETIRVNKTYPVLGLHLSQAEIIAACLALAGIGVMIFGYSRFKKA